MMKFKILMILVLSICIFSVANAQLIGGKKKAKEGADMDAKAEFDMAVQEARENARQLLKPYKYDGTKSTYYHYKTYTYAKEVEVLTIEKTDYRFSFDCSLIKDNIGIEIYDKPKTQKGRTLLYSSEDIGTDVMELHLDEMNTVFRNAKSQTSSLKPELIAKMRLKKIYINYVVPAVDRDLQTDEDGNKTRTTEFAAVVLAVGYKHL